MEVDEDVLDLEIGDEAENLARFGVPDGHTQWLRFFGGPLWKSSYLQASFPGALGGGGCPRHRSPGRPGRRQGAPHPHQVAPPQGAVCDEHTGDLLPARLAATAREEEVSVMEEGEVCGEAPISECLSATGQKPLGGRWVDCNKGDLR